MKQTFVAQESGGSSERGGARLKFLIVALILGLVAYSAYVFLPVAYDAYLYKDLMQHYVDVASVAGHPPDWAKDQLTKSSTEYNVPADAVITASQAENRVVVRVQFTRAIPFPGFTYNYEFDHTAKSTAFLSIK
jgi:hypothetical protein